MRATTASPVTTALRGDAALCSAVYDFQGRVFAIATGARLFGMTRPDRCAVAALIVLRDASGQDCFADWDAVPSRGERTERARLAGATAEAIRIGGAARRAAWTYAAQDGADILHTGPRTRLAHAISTALGHLQQAAEHLRED